MQLLWGKYYKGYNNNAYSFIYTQKYKGKGITTFYMYIKTLIKISESFF